MPKSKAKPEQTEFVKVTIRVCHGNQWMYKLSDGRSWYNSKYEKHERKIIGAVYPGLKHALKKLHDTITFEDTEGFFGPPRKTRRIRKVKRGLINN